MGFRFRKSFKVLPGVKINLGGKSAGVSVGGKYGGLSWNSRSGAHARASAYGTGISYRRKVGKKRKSQKLGFGGTLLLVAIGLGCISSLNPEKVAEVIMLALAAVLGLGAIYILFKIGRFFSRHTVEAEPPITEIAITESDFPEPVQTAPTTSESSKRKQAWLLPNDFDEYAELELSCPDSVFQRKPPVGSFLVLKPDPDYPRDSKAIKATWMYEGVERTAGYIKKSNADIRNLIREYWAADGQVVAQVRYNYDALGVFIGFNR